MNKSATLTVKIINDQDILDSLPKEKPLTDAQKDFIKFLARLAVQEYIKETKAAPPQENRHDRILRLPQVKEITGLSRASIYRYIQLEAFPKPLNLGARSVGWKESQITAWLDERRIKNTEY